MKDYKIELLAEEDEKKTIALCFKMMQQAFYAGLEATTNGGELSRQYEWGRYIVKNFMKNNEEFEDFIGVAESFDKEIDKILTM